ncbi:MULTISPECIES: hypothetical protein [Nitrospirillum]|uniref:Uncharacterized protein n=1 Tax=Nitrospirillum amazonense TaxID=28077 RepID=A0A560G1P0_9PROT|nr:hypothetical protein [Nitrospirillum amazonense]MEC4589440.1 hypothetical protein [Nitrospirillum amazonense]TWB27754.1 hypothetical protein FBZ88_106218 [Nitrospirillum amazonense]
MATWPVDLEVWADDRDVVLLNHGTAPARITVNWGSPGPLCGGQGIEPEPA